MASAFETEFNSLAMPCVEEQFGVSVYLSRGALKTATFTARRNRREHSAFAEELQIGIRVEQREYLLPVASVSLNGTASEPQVKDRIVEVDTGEVWEIHFPDSSTKAVERDSNANDWLVHTKLIKDAC